MLATSFCALGSVGGAFSDHRIGFLFLASLLGIGTALLQMVAVSHTALLLAMISLTGLAFAIRVPPPWGALGIIGPFVAAGALGLLRRSRSPLRGSHPSEQHDQRDASPGDDSTSQKSSRDDENDT
jgi:hypothetical protein